MSLLLGRRSQSSSRGRRFSDTNGLGLNRAALREPWLWVATGYLGACLALGGSSAGGIIANAVLQLLGTIITATLLARTLGLQLNRHARFLVRLGLAFLALALSQVIPLPPEIWSALEGRSNVVARHAALGIKAAWQPISLAPDGTLAAVLAAVPLLTLLSLVLRLGHEQRRWLIVALAVFATASAIFGLMQLTGGSGFYLYSLSSFGRSAGFFANANHQATLLLLALPMIASILPTRSESNRGWIRTNPMSLLLVAAASLMAVSAIATQSLAGLGLVVVAAVGSVLTLAPSRQIAQRGYLVAMVSAIVGAVLILGLAQYISVRASAEMATAVTQPGTRLDFLINSFTAIRAMGFFGSGLGSFVQLYPTFTPAEQFAQVFVNHAHNDWIEFVLETGGLGIALIVTFLVWFGQISIASMRQPGSQGQVARAALVGIVLVGLHSLVDYPMRTAAIAACFGMLCALACPPPAIRSHS